MKTKVVIVLLVVWVGLAILLLQKSEEKEIKPEVIIEEKQPEPIKQKPQPVGKTTADYVKELNLGDGTLTQTTTDAHFKTKRIKVYLGRDRYYHRRGCGQVTDKRRSLWLEDAIEQGYEPCTYCKPPLK